MGWLDNLNPFRGNQSPPATQAQAQPVQIVRDPTLQPGLQNDTYNAGLFSPQTGIMDPRGLLNGLDERIKSLTAQIRSAESFRASAKLSKPPEVFAAIQEQLDPVLNGAKQLLTKLLEESSKIIPNSVNFFYERMTTPSFSGGNR
ncbi:MAG: hypothetical protein SFU25_07575 [Candidatus Caenarcaniphilales bacterium]|nr:hypothetical protein [Candidatus Caenarcaniphilales bacterium]